MPIYEFQCKHGIKEIYFGKVSDQITYTFWDCGCIATRIFSLCAMQPDNMWSGVKTDHGYFTSKSEYLNNLKAKNLETITLRELADVRKNVAKAKKDKKEKQINNLKNHLTEELKGVTIDSDGNTLTQRNRIIRKQNVGND